MRQKMRYFLLFVGLLLSVSIGAQTVKWRDIYTVKTVSYTHLDVYKRQVYFCLVKAKGADGVVYNIKRDVNLLRGYTEEDVYKRQTITCRLPLNRPGPKAMRISEIPIAATATAVSYTHLAPAQ